eukprot:3080699-Rhodomonas_salina.2
MLCCCGGGDQVDALAELRKRGGRGTGLQKCANDKLKGEEREREEKGEEEGDGDGDGERGADLAVSQGVVSSCPLFPR